MRLHRGVHCLRRRVLMVESLEERRLLSYSVTDLGTLGGAVSYAHGINAVGQVVGEAATADGAMHAFLYSGGRMTDLGTLGGATSSAHAINAAGQIVGEAQTAAGLLHAFLYSGGQMTDLGTLGGPESVAYGINDAGQIVGEAETADLSFRAFLYSGGSMTDLGTLGGSDSTAFSISNAGQVVGAARPVTDDIWHAFLYSSGSRTDLGTLGGTESFAYAINDSGQIVGEAETTKGDSHAYLHDGQINDLGTLGGGDSFARGINSFGQAVGGSDITNFLEHAFLYDGFSITDLNTLLSEGSAGWELNQAVGINDDALIVGYGANPSGQNHAYLLVPDGSHPLRNRDLALFQAQAALPGTAAVDHLDQAGLVLRQSNSVLRSSPAPETAPSVDLSLPVASYHGMQDRLTADALFAERSGLAWGDIEEIS